MRFYRSNVTSLQKCALSTISSDINVGESKVATYIRVVCYFRSNKQNISTNSSAESKIQSTVLNWGEFFGFYPPTVTVTREVNQITTVQDPSVVVTYAIKGCVPQKMHMDMSRCPQESIIPTMEVLETSTVPSDIFPTKTLDDENTSTVYGDEITNFVQDDKNWGQNSPVIQPSSDLNEETTVSLATEPLQATGSGASN